MAHKTLVDGTAYEITGGKCLVEGTSYSIKNGKVLVDGAAYDISFLIPPSVVDFWSHSLGLVSINCVVHANGYWVVGGVYRTGNVSYARIMYSTSLSGPWSARDLWSSYNGSILCSFDSLAYRNGYWVAGGKRYGAPASNNIQAVISYATSPDATWTPVGMFYVGGSSNVGGCNAITGIDYANGYWVVCGTEYNSAKYITRIYYASSLSGTWTPIVLNDSKTTGVTSIANCLTYTNGYWVVGSRANAQTYSYYARIYYATSPNGTWATKDIRTETTSGYVCSITDITYANGYWVASLERYAGVTYCYSAYATTLSGTWSFSVVFYNFASGWSTDTATCVAYADGYWVLGGHRNDGTNNIPCIGYSISPSGPWTVVDLWSSTSVAAIIDATYSDGYWVLGGNRIVDGVPSACIAYSQSLEGFNEL